MAECSLESQFIFLKYCAMKAHYTTVKFVIGKLPSIQGVIWFKVFQPKIELRVLTQRGPR